MIVLIVNGVPDAGKNTLAEILAKLTNGRIISYSSIDWVKEKAYELGWDGVKDNAGRQLLNDIKQAAIAYADIPNRKVIEEIHKNERVGRYKLMCVDVREPDEIRKLKRACLSHEIACYTVLVENSTAEQKRMAEAINNPADANTHAIPYDIELENNSSKLDFERKIEIFMDALFTESIDVQDYLLFNPDPPVLDILNSDQYQKDIADHFDTLPIPILSEKSTMLLINALALCGEAGEIANIIKKIVWYRAGEITREEQWMVADEIGDNLYHSAQLATLLKTRLSQIMAQSTSKCLHRGKAGFKGE